MGKVISFFSGCMGLDLGLEQAGFEVIFACEKNNAAIKTIKANKPDLHIETDIVNLNAEKIREICKLKNDDEIDIVCGGPPCQSYTTCGLRKGVNDPRGNLLLVYIDLAISLNPNYIVMENVRGIISSKIGELPVLKYVQQKLKEKGYESSYKLYDAVNFGVPQRRERIILIANKDSKPLFLTPTHSNDAKYNLPKWITIKEALKDLTKPKIRDYYIISDHNWEFFQHIKEGENWKNLPIELQKKAMKGAYDSSGGKTGFFRRLKWNEPCITISCNPMNRAQPLAHPDERRYLSVSECKRIQTFPDNWILCGGIDNSYRQLGNAVPVKFAKEIGVSINMHKNGMKFDEKFKDFNFSRFKEKISSN